jgi:hypothetical protein
MPASSAPSGAAFGQDGTSVMEEKVNLTAALTHSTHPHSTLHTHTRIHTTHPHNLCTPTAYHSFPTVDNLTNHRTFT